MRNYCDFCRKEALGAMKRIAVIALLLFIPVKMVAARAVTDSLLLRYGYFVTWCSPEKAYLHLDRTCYTAGETVWFRGWVQDASAVSALPPSNFLYAEVLDARGETVVRVKIKRTETGVFPGSMELPESLETGDYTVRGYTLWQMNAPADFFFNERIRVIGIKKEKKEPVGPSPDIDVSFWPEGGRYFAGKKASVGFRVVDAQGRSVDFEGVLVSDEGGPGKRVSTLHDGMGRFSFLPKPGHRYSLRDASGKLYPLPAPSEEGATLRLQIHAGRYYIGALGYGGGTASLLVRDASELRPLAQVGLDGKMASYVMEKDFFRPGINHFLLVDARGSILAERLFFVRDAEAPVCSLETGPLSGERRSLVSGTVLLQNPDGTPLDGHCSVSVVRGALKDWQQADGIVSYMGLSSELKGRINNPSYYFDPAVPELERDEALDVLMLIQGWRYYDLEKFSNVSAGGIVIRYRREREQIVRGHISRRHSSKVPTNFNFTFMVPSQGILQSVDVSKGSVFVVDSLDFPENTKMLINISDSRLFSHYLPKWDGDPAPGPHLYKPAPGSMRGMAPVEPPLNESAWTDTLQAAVVVASYDDDVLVFGRNYREDLSVYRDMSLVEYLSMRKAMFEYDGEYMYNRNRMRKMLSDEEEDDDPFADENDDTGRVKLIVDDTEEAWWAYEMLQLEDLRTLSISTQPDPVFGGSGGVVRITVKPGAVRREENRNPSLLYFVPLGYQVPRYFESPRYDLGESGPYDARNTVWWSPDVAVEGGRATIEFCTGDLPDYPYLIRIEGLDSRGRPFSCHQVLTPSS